MSSIKIYQDKHPYFVTINIKQRIPIFNNPKYAQLTTAVLFGMPEKYNFKLLGYSIMPDHLHVFIRTSPKYNISEIIQHFKSLVYFNFRKGLNFKDKFWQKSFDYRIKDSDKEIQATLEYIKNNPKKWLLPKMFHEPPYLFISE